jgi:hypothetical protein
LPWRAQLGLLSNILDVFQEDAKAYASMSLTKLHKELTTQKGKPAFDKNLLQRYGKQVAVHLLGAHTALTASCAFIKSLKAAKSSKQWSDRELLQSAKEAEVRSNQYPWGQPKRDESSSPAALETNGERASRESSSEDRGLSDTEEEYVPEPKRSPSKKRSHRDETSADYDEERPVKKIKTKVIEPVEKKRKRASVKSDKKRAVQAKPAAVAIAAEDMADVHPEDYQPHEMKKAMVRGTRSDSFMSFHSTVVCY